MQYTQTDEKLRLTVGWRRVEVAELQLSHCIGVVVA